MSSSLVFFVYCLVVSDYSLFVFRLTPSLSGPYFCGDLACTELYIGFYSIQLVSGGLGEDIENGRKSVSVLRQQQR